MAPGSFTVPSRDEKSIEATSAAGGGDITIATTGSNAIVNSGTAHYTGLKFNSTASFYVVSQIDADGGGESGKGILFDWGFPLLPSDQLTSQVLVAFGRGCTNLPIPNDKTNGICDDKSISFNKAERSVVWVTPVDDTKIFVDYEGDGIFDDVFILGALESLRLTDTKNNDFDMTGAVIASFTVEGAGMVPEGTPVKIAVAWGQDPVRSGGSDEEALDLGTAVVPLVNPFVNKNVVKVTNPDGTIDPRLLVDQVG